MMKGERSYAREWVINGSIWELKFVNEMEDKRNVGLSDPSERVNYIKRGQGPVETARSFFHEKVHSFEAEYNFSLDHRHVYKLETALCDFMMQNFKSLAKIFK